MVFVCEWKYYSLLKSIFFLPVANRFRRDFCFRLPHSTHRNEAAAADRQGVKLRRCRCHFSKRNFVLEVLEVLGPLWLITLTRGSLFLNAL